MRNISIKTRDRGTFRGFLQIEFLYKRLLSIFVLVWVLLPGAAHADDKGACAVLFAADQLDLTPTQRSKISGILREAVQEYNQVAQTERGTPGLGAKLNRIRNKSQQEALALLTPKQRTLWEARTVKPGANKSLEDQIAARSLIIPTIEQLKNPTIPGEFGPSTGLVETEAHAPLGDGYVIVTDHEDERANKALQRLADFRGGEVISVESLGTLHESPAKFEKLRKRLQNASPRYVAIAPRAESYRENMHLCMLKLITELDSDPSLDAFPGYLIASGPGQLEELIERTIKYKSISKGELAPVSIGAIEDSDARRYRSYQKAMVMQKMFSAEGTNSPAIIITTRKSHTERSDFPIATSTPDKISMLPTLERQTFRELSTEAAGALNENNVLFMFGHGVPEKICGVDVRAYEEIDFSNELVFCGSCLSASPYKSDRDDLEKSKDSKRFAFHAVDNGAVLMLGHMGLCGGFPKIYPMGEMVLDGLSTGEAYQRLMNSLIGDNPIPPFYKSDADGRQGERAANGLLYVVWGDPALIGVARSDR